MGTHLKSALSINTSPTFSSIILHVVIMIRPLLALATGALVVLTVVAEIASAKYENVYNGDFYGKSTSSYGDDSYKHEPEYREEKYTEPSYKKYDDEYGYEEHKYDHKPMIMKFRYGYGGDSYGKSYGDDFYGKSYSSNKPSSYRPKRSVGGDQSTPFTVPMRDHLKLTSELVNKKFSEMASGIREEQRLICYRCDRIFPCAECCLGNDCIECESWILGEPTCEFRCCEARP